MDEFIGKGLSWTVIIESMGWASLTFIPMALPLSTLLASLMTMGNLGENNELLAIKAAGISLQRILQPLFVLVFIVVVIGGFFASNNLVPYSNLKFRSLLYDIKKKNPELSIPEGIFYNGMPGYSIWIEKKDPESKALINVMIYDHKSNRGNISLTLADSGYIKQTPDQQNLLLTLYNGRMFQEEMDSKTGRFRPDRAFSRRWFDEQTMIISLGNIDLMRTDESFFRNQAKTQNIVQLDYSYDSLSTVKAGRIKSFENQIIHTGIIFDMPRELDTVSEVRARHVKEINADSIFQSLSATKKVDVLERTISRVGNVSNQVDNYVADYIIYNKQVVSVQIEWHKKLTLSVACIIFFFIGAPLGAIIRKGGLGMPSVISIFFFVIYWVIDISCEKMAKSGAMNPVIATWFSSIILAPVAVFLTYKATTDSSLFNSDRYVAFFNKIFGRMKKLVHRINLDEIMPANDMVSNIEIEREILELNNLSRQFESEYKLYKNFVWSPEKWSMLKGQDKLNEIGYKYDTLISQLLTIDDNERLREQLRQYPELNVEKYRLSDLYMKLQILFFIFGFIIGFIMYILVLNKRKKLRYILNEIVDINNTVSVILGKR